MIPIKSPLNYIGGKTKILNQILPLFPQKIDIFVDLFAGGCNVGINTNAEKIYFNDNLTYLVNMFQEFKDKEFEFTINFIENRINEFNLSNSNQIGYNQLRDFYNKDKNPLDLFVLIAYSFNHQIRFNNSHNYNNPFGRKRSTFNSNMKMNLQRFIYRLKCLNCRFTDTSFENFDFSQLSEKDFVYCDPPYLITNGSYNDGKRGFKGWTDVEENSLLKVLDDLDSRKIRFALSNVLEHKGKSNEILRNWIQKKNNYRINYINKNYSNSSYHTRNRDVNASTEVMITNYLPQNYILTKNLFEEIEVKFA